MKEKTKIEGEVKGNRIVVRRIFVNSGKVSRVLLDVKATNQESARAQLKGAMQYIGNV